MPRVSQNTKEYKIPLKNHFKSLYGTFDKEKPSVLYLNAKAKVEPLDKKTTYAKDVKHVKKVFAEYLKDFFASTDKYSKNFIHSCEMSEDNMVFGKKSNVKFEVLVKPVVKKKFDEYLGDMEELSTVFSEKLSEIMETNKLHVS